MLRRILKWLTMLSLLTGLVACGKPEPIVIGLIAGLSDRGSDFGESVRNGVILAIEQQNTAGGIDGRMLELVIRDDGQNREQAVRAARELIALGPEIVIGPVTSSMAAVVVPLMNDAGLTLISPTVASPDFVGIDDQFFRVNRSTRAAAEHHAEMLFARGARRTALAYDTSNGPYSNTWLAAYRDRFAQLGGEVVAAVPFASSAQTGFAGILAEMLPGQPDSLLFVASSLDTARLCQQARKQAPKLLLSSTEWAASGEFLVEMGGEAVEGLLIAHAYNRNDNGRFQVFRQAYRQRFQREFGSFSPLAHDTANIVFTALGKRRPGQTMKAALLGSGPYRGLQQEISFDAWGDATRQVYFTEIRNGQFVQLQ
ncbi:MAG: ABC transporter substrate-binding protein [Azonexus sp.]|nr:ABC transporter substrate-binding protein [Azonexus sp.]MCK6412814.1 ABC transporter substrate-binding protein [Azonexus sp.]